MHDIYGVGPLGQAGGTEVNLGKSGSGNNELKEFLTDPISKGNSYGSGLKRSNSSSGRLGSNGHHPANTFDSYGNKISDHKIPESKVVELQKEIENIGYASNVSRNVLNTSHLEKGEEIGISDSESEGDL